MIEELGLFSLQNVTTIGVLIAWVCWNMYDKKVTMQELRLAIDNNTIATQKLTEMILTYGNKR